MKLEESREGGFEDRRGPKMLKLVGAGDEALRQKCRKLTEEEVRSEVIQSLIDDIKFTCDENEYGVGLSANQVGESMAISVIAIKPTLVRPNRKVFEKVLVNAEIVETYGEPKLMWEGCVSTAQDENGEPAMAQVMRFKKVKVKYLDRGGEECEEVVSGFVAHVLQHEVDHLEGKLFTDFIEKGSLVSNKEYRAMIAARKDENEG
ncbi:peptide deformylase [Candidatus Saccharibacteria bacterium]|nr:peptide deformylase [Candidatus Saccharibacteria bacterium]